MSESVGYANDDEIIADGLRLVRSLRLPPLPVNKMLSWPTERTYAFHREIYRRRYRYLMLMLRRFYYVLLKRTSPQNIRFQFHFALVYFEDQVELMTDEQIEQYDGVYETYINEALFRQPGVKLLRRAIMHHYKRRLLEPGTNWMRNYGDICSLQAFIELGQLDFCLRDDLEVLVLIIVRCLRSNVFWLMYRGLKMADVLLANPSALSLLDPMPVYSGIYGAMLKMFSPGTPPDTRPMYDLWGELMRRIALMIRQSPRDNPMDSITEQVMVMYFNAIKTSKTIPASNSLALDLIRFIQMDCTPQTIRVAHYRGYHSEYVALKINGQKVPLSRLAEADIPTIVNKRLFRWTVPLLQLIRKEMSKYAENCTKYIQFLNMVLLLIIDCPGVRFDYADPAVTASSMFYLLRGILRIIGLQAKMYKLHPLTYRWDLGQFLATHNVLKCFRERMIKKLPATALPAIMTLDEAFLAELDQLFLIIQGHFLESEICRLAAIHEEYAFIDISDALRFTSST